MERENITVKKPAGKLVCAGNKHLVRRSSCVMAVPKLHLKEKPPVDGEPREDSWWPSICLTIPLLFSPNLDQPRGGRTPQSEA